MRQPITFNAADITLRGWLQRPEKQEEASPLIIMTHGFAGVKEWLTEFADVFCQAGFACLLYDHPNWGASDGEPRNEVDPWAQVRAYRHAISYAQTLEGIDPQRIGIWGTSFSGAHVLVVAAVDRRVRAVVSQVPLTDAWGNLCRLVPSTQMKNLRAQLEQDRLNRYRGEAPVRILATSDDPLVPAAMPGEETYRWLMQMAKRAPDWRNEVTLGSMDLFQEYAPEAYLERISPTPLLMILANDDTLTPTDLQLTAYARAHEPKQLLLIKGPHHTVYQGDGFQQASAAARDWFIQHL